MKEIAVTASSGKHDNELIGRAAITLKVGKDLIISKILTLKKTHISFSLFPFPASPYGITWKREARDAVEDHFWLIWP